MGRGTAGLGIALQISDDDRRIHVSRRDEEETKQSKVNLKDSEGVSTFDRPTE